MTGYEFRTVVDGARLAEVEEALGYVESRLLGRMPRALSLLCTQLADAFWDGATASGEAIRVVGADGAGASSTSAVDELTPEQLAAEEAAVAELVAWEASPEAAVEEAFWRFEETRRAETAQAYRAWLEEQAQAFAVASGRWRRARREQLRREFRSVRSE